GEVLRPLADLKDKAASGAFAPGGELVAIGTETGAIKFWNTEDGAPLPAIAGQPVAIHGVSFHPNGKQLAASAADGTISIWNLPVAARELAGHTAAAQRLTVSTDGKIAVTTSSDKSVRLWNIAEAESL